MNSRLVGAVALAVVFAAGVAFFASHRDTTSPATSPASVSTALASPPPGINPDRWLPLSPAAGLALHPESQATSPDVELSGDLWAFVDGHWHIVRLPALAPPSGPGTVPAAFVAAVRSSTTPS